MLKGIFWVEEVASVGCPSSGHMVADEINSVPEEDVTTLEGELEVLDLEDLSLNEKGARKRETSAKVVEATQKEVKISGQLGSQAKEKELEEQGMWFPEYEVNWECCRMEVTWKGHPQFFRRMRFRKTREKWLRSWE